MNHRLTPIAPRRGKLLLMLSSPQPDAWRDDLACCAEHMDCFDDHERNFLRSMARWLGQRTQNWLAALAVRVRGAA
jgi:hypothetical protein